MSNFTFHKLLDACKEDGCPACRVEQQNVERYLENQLYENVNSPKWRNKLRDSLGFCYEHAWLAVDRRLGDALGFSIIYQDILNSILNRMDEQGRPVRGARHWTALLRKVPEQARTVMDHVLYAITPAKRCPVCEHREEAARTILTVLVNGLKKPEMLEALLASDGLCLPHLQRALQEIKDMDTFEKLIGIHRAKIEGLKFELGEFIRKNDYEIIQEGFGSEGDAWLRAIALVVGGRKK